MRTNNAADEQAPVLGAGSVSSAVSSSKGSVIDLPDRKPRTKLKIHVHWGLLFAVGASLALWLMILGVIRFFF